MKVRNKGMTYYINPIWFYLMNVSDWMHLLFLILGFFTIFFGVVAIILYLCVDNDKECIHMWLILIAAGVVATFIGAVIPSKSTCIEMMIASQVTKENVDASREEIYSIIDYVTDKLNSRESEE